VETIREFRVVTKACRGGGPVRRNRVFFFGGYERLQEDLSQTVIAAVPTAAARAGSVNPGVKPYLDLYPLPNGRDLTGGIAQYVYPFARATRENFGQARIDVQLRLSVLAVDRHGELVTQRERVDGRRGPSQREARH
jgi:hypothetical protein